MNGTATTTKCQHCGDRIVATNGLASSAWTHNTDEVLCDGSTDNYATPEEQA